MDGKIPVEEIPAYWQSLPVKTVEVMSPLMYGPADAKITVLEFSDFACPYCAIAADSMMTYLKSQPDIRVMFFPFPLDSQCNRAITRSMHPGVCDWSKLALCAHQQDRFWQVHDWIFAQMRSHQRLPQVEDSWASLGLDVEKAKSCMASAETDAQLKEMVEAGLKLDIQSTPTFIFNGRPISGVLPVPVLRHLLTEARK
jgi:protein-disulfide isomerase